MSESIANPRMKRRKYIYIYIYTILNTRRTRVPPAPRLVSFASFFTTKCFAHSSVSKRGTTQTMSCCAHYSDVNGHYSDVNAHYSDVNAPYYVMLIIQMLMLLIQMLMLIIQMLMLLIQMLMLIIQMLMLIIQMLMLIIQMLMLIIQMLMLLIQMLMLIIQMLMLIIQMLMLIIQMLMLIIQMLMLIIQMLMQQSRNVLLWPIVCQTMTIWFLSVCPEGSQKAKIKSLKMSSIYEYGSGSMGDELCMDGDVSTYSHTDKWTDDGNCIKLKLNSKVLVTQVSAF